ncbi:MAG: ATP-binding protein, partial [Methyloligellaceae bacterium]
SPPPVEDSDFNTPFSGWYWQIKQLGGDGKALYSSDSLLGHDLTLPSKEGTEPDEAGIWFAIIAGPDNQQLRIIEREIVLEVKDAPKGAAEQIRYAFAVAGQTQFLEENVEEFTTQLTIALAILGVGLVLATFVQVRYGLRPLRVIGHGLAAIRSGRASDLKGSLPTEIEPLQQELNALIQSNRAIVERARTHVGNLAHALKTPLSVITNEARNESSPFAKKVSEQAALMSDQVTHHLDRARMAARSGVVSGVTDIQPVMESLVRALGKIYASRQIEFHMDCAADTKFRGEKQDLEEMTGNLLDNACKWAHNEVELVVARPPPSTEGTQKNMTIFVDDDGPGLTAEERTGAVKRGRRMDESKPGSGLGLSIVAELAHLYKGDLALESSPKGGLRARLTLPCS